MTTMLTDPDLCIGVANMEHFLSDHLSDFLVETRPFNINQGNFEEEAKINIFVGSPAYHDYFPHNYGCTILVDSLDDLHSWQNKLLTAPILLDVQCKTMPNADESPHIEEGYWAVVVNTRNSLIRELMEPGFKDAEAAIKEGRRYMLEFDFRESLTDWFRKTVNPHVKCYFAKLKLTNHMFFEDLNRMLCGYEKWIGVILGIICCPCITCGVCVNMIRVINRLEKHIHVTGTIKALKLTVSKDKGNTRSRLGQRTISGGGMNPTDSSSYGATDDVSTITETTKLLE
ncbi:uncharacterized protein LOC102800673 [Saccoglossus kowalevskii]|uniref:Uncharacterized protein LOC102800673 n=1 Tax=Saccoglossus kowalevskii TaxID=10224 RepID=A0ABM0MPR9_SACKO|nr:PREDICTED: uncharacterized protein LOC102800673 [Saccoglossus kowalevskii]